MEPGHKTDGIVTMSDLEFLFMTRMKIWNGTIFIRQKMLVRHDADGKLYLYDIIRTKRVNEHPVWTALSQSHGHKTRFIWL